MLINAKINLKKYALFSCVLLIATAFLAKNIHEWEGMLIIFTAACLNQWMLVNLVREASQSAAEGVPVDKFNMFAMIVAKVVVLVVAISFGVQIMGNRVIIPVLIYVLQIAVLYLSFD